MSQPLSPFRPRPDVAALIATVLFAVSQPARAHFSSRVLHAADDAVMGILYDREGKRLGETQVDPDKVDWELLSGKAAESQKYTGVGRLHESGVGSCTGAFIDV